MKSVLVTVTMALCATLGGLETASATGQATPTAGGLSPPALVAQDFPPGWVPWDGNHITTAAKCENRRKFLSGNYGIPLTQLLCFKVTTNMCPSVTYWIVLYFGGAIAAHPETPDIRTPVSQAC